MILWPKTLLPLPRFQSFAWQSPNRYETPRRIRRWHLLLYLPASWFPWHSQAKVFENSPCFSLTFEFYLCLVSGEMWMEENIKFEFRRFYWRTWGSRILQLMFFVFSMFRNQTRIKGTTISFSFEFIHFFLLLIKLGCWAVLGCFFVLHFHVQY